MITIARCSKPEEAHLVRMRLETEGIDATVRDEFTVQLNWLYSNALGGVRVEVSEADEERAREILALPDVHDAQPFFPACPACGATTVRPDSLLRRLSYLVVLILWFPLPIKKWTLRCVSCKHRWTWQKESES